mgnify:CR=1 FL=1
MLTGKAKTDYQREYMRKYRAGRSVRPTIKALDLVRPKPVRPKVQHDNPMMAGYVPVPK